MFKKIVKNNIIRFSAAFIAASLLTYFLVAPLVISQLFPQYAIVKSYTNIAVCTDLAPGTPSKVFLPISCNAVDKSHALACISTEISHYFAPAKASANETQLCPLLVSGNDATGAKNPALAVLPIEEKVLQLIITSAIMLGLMLITLAVILIRRRSKRQKVAVTIEQS
jgi:hypothetical protein